MAVTVTEEIRSRLRIRSELPPPGERAELRQKGGLTQQELARIVGVSRAAVAQWESGARRPRGAFLDRYAEALRALRDVR